ncbi:hypothetical protein M422DRAFT_276771 [Sphaerobolus stellatus SS14]|uniref:Uncharacterized protein n=1 Tax=Sphaerobolus stellatus (strain SS14) TaxID=990650 RepID=A0A0C9UB57_SPHS4|nr:hypothetical protein M422DRAFT_276771 [Sphaerobolus stellatus SS14]
MNHPHTPTSFRTPSACTTPSTVDRFEEELRKTVFAQGRDMTRQAVESGLWYDFAHGDVDSPMNGVRILPADISEAFANYQIPEAHCLCTTQETTPAGRRKHTLWIRVKHAAAPSLSDWMNFINMLIWILRFNAHNIDIEPTTIFQPTANPTAPAPALAFAPPPTSPLSVNQPPLPSSSHQPGHPSPPSSSSSGHHRPHSESVSNSPAYPFKMPRLGQPSPSPFIEASKAKGKDEGRAVVQTYEASDSDDAAMLPSPTPAPRHRRQPAKPFLPPRYSTLPPQAGPSNGAGSLQDEFHAVFNTFSMLTGYSATHRLPYEPSERFFGDVGGLDEPVDTDLLAVRNSDVPLLTEEQAVFYMESLRQPDGVSHEVFWMLMDRCNCGRYFTKDYLHRVHETIASYHTYRPPRPPSSPAHSVRFPPASLAPLPPPAYPASSANVAPTSSQALLPPPAPFRRSAAARQETGVLSNLMQGVVLTPLPTPTIQDPSAATSTPLSAMESGHDVGTTADMAGSSSTAAETSTTATTASDFDMLSDSVSSINSMTPEDIAVFFAGAAQHPYSSDDSM